MASGAERAEPGDSEQDEEDVYEVERIIDVRVEEGEVLYRVRWKNYSSEDDTWEPEAHLDDCKEVLLAYKKALAELKPKKEPAMLPMKSDLFDADSESESDKEKPKESPMKKKKKKKKKKMEDSDDEMSVREKKKKKKKEKWREDKPLPAPESDEEEESRDLSPAPSKKETKKRFIDSDDEDIPVTPKKQKKLDKPKDAGKVKKESGEERKKKKIKSKKEIDSSDEDEKSDAASESHTDDTTNTETNDSFKTTTKITEKPVRSESGGDLKQVKQKKDKSDIKLQGFKDLILEKKPKKPEASSAAAKDVGVNKIKSLTGSKSTSKSSRSEEEPDSSDTGAAASVPKAKVKSKGQEAAPSSQRLSSASSSSSSSTASTAPIKPREEEAKEEAGDKASASNLFEKFLLNCEAKDRAPRRQADQNKSITPKGGSKNDKKTKSSKQSPGRKPDSDKTKDVPRSSQSPVSMEVDEKQEKGSFELEKSDKSDEPTPKSKEELQREQREEEQRKRKEKMEEEERKRKERIEEEERKKKERIEEAQRERKARLEEAQKFAEEARQELERKSMAESIVSPDSTEDSRWKDKRRKRRDDSESRVFTACDDNQDSQETVERSDKTPDRGPPSLNLGVELKLDWMTLEDFQKHLNGEDENLSPLALTPTELREAVKNGNYLAVKRALSSKEDYNLDQEDSSGMSLTLLAAAGGQDDILRLLIKKGVKVNSRQKTGTTALMHAADKVEKTKNFLTTVAILLEAGASVNAQTLGGETALMKACKRGNADVVRLLLEYGADCNILSKHKNTALYYAKLSNNLMVYDLIKDHVQTLSTVAEETIRAYFETRLALLEPVFPLACHRLCEGPDFSLEFNYKPPQHAPGEGSGILLFIFHANFLNEITARLCGPCSVHAVVLNDKFQLPIFLDSHFIYSFSPVQGANKMFIRLAESPTAKVKLLICAYRVQLQ